MLFSFINLSGHFLPESLMLSATEFDIQFYIIRTVHVSCKQDRQIDPLKLPPRLCMNMIHAL